jgi:hypothetical protein
MLLWLLSPFYHNSYKEIGMAGMAISKRKARQSLGKTCHTSCHTSKVGMAIR